MLSLNSVRAMAGFAIALCLANSMSTKQTVKAAPAAKMTEADLLQPNEGDACIDCHQEEVNGFERSKMAQSMHLPSHEPEGIVRTPQTTLRTYSKRDGTWQTLESHGQTETYRVKYVIGSGTHKPPISIAHCILPARSGIRSRTRLRNRIGPRLHPPHQAGMYLLSRWFVHSCCRNNQ